MLRNYLLTAYKVLLRRKFFTFVNLFAVALTLAVLTVVIALLENAVRPTGAESRSDHYLFVEDALLTNTEGTWTWSSRPGFRMIERYFLPLETPDRIGLIRGPDEAAIFQGERKLSPQLAGTDHQYWEILDFEFLAGRKFSAEDVEQGRFVAILNRSTSRDLFGKEESVGETFVANGQRFEVVGVVEDIPVLHQLAFSEIWVPYTTAASSSFRSEWVGDFRILLYADDPARLPLIEEEAWAAMEGFVHDDPERFQIGKAPANSKLSALARNFLERRYERDSRNGLFVAILVGVMLAFMVLPAINLINLNVSRILERASEIGVRKAFGASSRDLVRQFLVENVLLSLVGGVLGFALGAFLLEIVERSGMIPYAAFEIDLTVFLGAVVAMTVFGVLSGVLPAYKMAKFHPVRALRGG